MDENSTPTNLESPPTTDEEFTMDENSTPPNLESPPTTDEEFTMDENSTPPNLESHPTTDEEFTIDENSTPHNLESHPTTDEEYMNDRDAESETDNLCTEGDESLENLNASLHPSPNPSEVLKNSSSKNNSEDIRPSLILPLVIKVPGILNMDLWRRKYTEEEFSAKPRTMSFWRAGLIKNIGTEIIAKPLDKTDAERPSDARESNQLDPMQVESDTKQPNLPSFVTSVKDRMSIFRGQTPTKCLGKLFSILHDKLITARCKLEEKHQSHLEDRKLTKKCLEKRKLMLDQARKDALVVNTEGKLFGRDLLSINEGNPYTAFIEVEILSRYLAVSPIETKACFEKAPVHRFVRKVVEEHSTVVFSRSTCILCLKLLTLLNDSDIEYLNFRLDKMGVYGDRVSDYVRAEYTNNLPANVYFHGMHPEFVRKCYSVIEKNSDSDAMIGLFPDTYDLIVVGGTSLGLQTVFEARLLGVKVCLIESPLMPAAARPITFLGKSTLSEPDVSKKILYHLLSLRNRARKYQGYYSSDSMQNIHSDWTKLAESARRLIAKIGRNNVNSIHDVGAGFLRCGVKFVDRHTVEITNSESEKYRLRSSFFVMANPMQHRIPNIPGSQYCFTPDQIFSLPNTPGKTLIYGASRSAIEYAGLLGSMGFPVTVMAPAKIMEECDGNMVKCIKDNLKNYGVTIIDDCVLTAIKLVTDNGGKDKNQISRSDESLYKFIWNPLQKRLRKRNKQTRRRGRFVRQCSINKVIEQALLAWDVSPNVVKTIAEAGPAMRQLEELNGITKFDAAAHNKKIESLRRQKAAIKRWFAYGDTDNRCFGRLNLRNARSRRLRKRRFRGGGRNSNVGRSTLLRKKGKKKCQRKFVTLFLSPSPNERIMTLLDFSRHKRPPLRKTEIRYGPHYSYNPKSKVGVYFPGGTALRLSKKSKYYKNLRPIKPHQKPKRRKMLPFSRCGQPGKDVIACLQNLKMSLQDTAVEGYHSEDISLEEEKGMRTDNIIQEYNIKHFEIVDNFKSHVLKVDFDGDVTYNFDHKIFEKYVVNSLYNIDTAIKQILMISRAIDFRSECLTILRFLTKIIQTIRIFHLYINWKIGDCKTKIKKSRKRHRDPYNVLQFLNKNLIVKLKCKAVRKNMFEVIMNLESILTFTFISACNAIVEESNECDTESEDVSTIDSSLGGSFYRPRKGTRNISSFARRSSSKRKSYGKKDEQVPFNIRRFCNKSRYIRTCMGGLVDIVDPYLSNKDARLYFEGIQSSPFGSNAYYELRTKSSTHEHNSQLKKSITLFEHPPKVKKFKKIAPIKSEISQNILSRLKKQNANKKAIEKQIITPKEIVPRKDSLVSKDMLDLKDPSPHPLPDRKKIENLRIRGVRSELEFTCFIRDKITPKTVTHRVHLIRQPKRKYEESGEKSLTEIKMHSQIMMKQIIHDNDSKTSQNIEDNKIKFNFRNFVAFNFGRRYKLKCSLSQRDKYLSTLVMQTDAKAKRFKPLKWGSLAMYQKKVSRDRNTFVQILKQKQKFRPKPRGELFYKYGVYDSITEGLGLSTAQPRYTNSLVSLVSLQRPYPELLISSTIDNIDFDPSIPSVGSVYKEISLRTEIEEKSTNNLCRIMQNRTQFEDLSPSQGDEVNYNKETASPGMHSDPTSKLEQQNGQSHPVTDLARTSTIDNYRENLTKSAVSTVCPRRKIVKKTIKHGTEKTVYRKAEIGGRISESNSSSSISEKYTYTLKAAPPGMDRSLPVNLDSYIKGEAPVVDLRNLGSVDRRNVNLRSELFRAVSLDLFSKSLDRYASLVRESFIKLCRKKEALIKSKKERTSVVLTSKDYKSRCCNTTDGSSRSTKPTPFDMGVGMLQKDGANTKYTKNINPQTNGKTRQRKNNKTKKRLKKKRCQSLHSNLLKLQQLCREQSEDALNFGVIPLDGRAQLEYQLDQKLKKIREEAKSFIDLIEDLKQYAILSKIVKLFKLQERYKRRISEQPIDVEPQLFPDHSVYKVTGKFKNALLDDFKGYFNTIIIAGRQMCPAQDINFHDVGVTTCHLNGKIYTNSLDQTTVPTIYSIGECVYGWSFENYGSVIAAQYLVRRLFTDFEETPEVQLCIRSVHTYPLQYAFVGLSEEEARKRYRNVVTYIGSFKTLPSKWFSNEDAPSILKFVCHMEAPEMEKVVGIHFYNEQASDTIQGYAAAMKNGLYYKEVQDLIAICPVNTECLFQFDMDRKEYENLEIHETEIFESNSSSQSESISPYEETESVCPEDLKPKEVVTESSKDSDEHTSYSSDDTYSDEHDSFEYSHEDSIIENEDQGIPEILLEEEINEQEDIQYEEEIEEEIESEEEIQFKEQIESDEEIEDEEETNSAETEDDEFEELSLHTAPVSQQKRNNLDSVEGSVFRSQSEHDRLTIDTSETEFMSICTPEEQSSNTPHYTPEDISIDEDSFTPEGFFICTDGDEVKEIINERSSMRCVDEKESSVVGEKGSSVIDQKERSVVGEKESSVADEKESSVVDEKESSLSEDTSSDSFRTATGYDSASVWSSEVNESSSESENSSLSGRISHLPIQDSGEGFKDDTLEKSNSSIFHLSPCPSDSTLKLELNFKLESVCVDAIIFNSLYESDSDSNDSMTYKQISKSEEEYVSKKCPIESMNLTDTGNLKSSVEKIIGKSGEERKSHYSEGHINRAIVNKEMETTDTKFQSTNTSKQRQNILEVHSPPTAQEESDRSPVNKQATYIDAVSINQVTNERNLDPMMLSSTRPPEGESDSKKLKGSQKRLMKYKGGVHVKKRGISGRENKKQNVDTTGVQNDCAKSSGNSQVMSTVPVTAGPSVEIENFGSTESTHNASETTAHPSEIWKTMKFRNISTAARNVLTRWIRRIDFY